MSKKLFAVAAATALALSALVAAPAVAAPSFAITDADGGAGTTASPYTIKVPDTNTVDSTNSITFAISALEADDVVTVTTTGTVKVIEGSTDVAASPFYNVTTLSKASLTKTIASGTTTYSFQAHTTSTTTGTVSVAIARPGLNVSNSYSIKGTVGAAYKITATGGVPASLASGKTSVVTFTVADAFGNLIETLDTTTVTRSSHMGVVSWDSTAKVYKSTMTAPSASPFIASLALNGDVDPTVDGFADADYKLTAVVNSAGNASLTAQVAALTAQLAESRPKATSVTKKKYNTLARKWNAAFPSQKVALKK